MTLSALAVLAQVALGSDTTVTLGAVGLLAVGFASAVGGLYKANRAESELRRIEDLVHAIDKRTTATETSLPALLRDIGALREELQRTRVEVLAAIQGAK